MPFIQTINGLESISAGSDTFQLIREFQLLRAELDDIRAKYAATVALLTAGTAVGAGYATGTGLAPAKFTPT